MLGDDFRLFIHKPALALIAAVAMLAPACARAEDVAPKVLPDMIADVPATKPDPFPAFDNFAWRAFVALAWPALTDAAHRGEPDRAKKLGDPGPRVWETFKSRSEIFLAGPDGRPRAPAAWASYDGENPCGPDADNHAKTLAAFRPYADFNQATITPGKLTGPLVAQNRTYTRFEVRFNEAEFDSIVAHKWYIRARLPNAEKPAHFNLGSIGVKAAWRVLTDADTPAVRKRYYVVDNAQVLDVAKSIAAGKNVCSRRDIALVGLHIVVKTQYRPQWIWSSFEHVDNVPPAGTGAAREPDAKDAHAPYSYFDATKPAAPLGEAPPAVDASHPPKLDPDPPQVTRRHPINAETMAMNRAYWALPEIRGTVWANYMLVATQWPTVPRPIGPHNNGQFFPGMGIDPDTPAEPYQKVDDPKAINDNLANTTMETFAQDAPSSCMSCHHVVSNALGRDFVAIAELDDAKPPMDMAQASEPAGLFHGSGVVLAVDGKTGALTLRHSDIPGFMPAMEMMFRVDPPSLSRGLHVGDTIKFDIEGPGGIIRSVEVIERAR